MSTQKRGGIWEGPGGGGYFLNTWLASTSNWEIASRSHLQAAETIHSMETSSGVEADQGESHLNCQAPLQLSHGTPSLACPENVWNQILMSVVVPGIFWSKQWVYLTWKYIKFSLHHAILWINQRFCDWSICAKKRFHLFTFCKFVQLVSLNFVPYGLIGKHCVLFHFRIMSS